MNRSFARSILQIATALALSGCITYLPPELDGSGSDGGERAGSAREDAEVFAQTAVTLFRLDPLTNTVTTVGRFSGCQGEVLDIALDKDGVMFGTTSTFLYRIDKKTAVCTPVNTTPGNYPNSLSFVPKGTVDPNEEALVGYFGDSYVHIDTRTGAQTTIGTLGGGLSSSGDIVSAIGGGTYLTVIGPECNDCIVEVDPRTGALLRNIGTLGHDSVFGLAFWGGLAYGFDAKGELFAINLPTSTAVPIPMPDSPVGLSFYGAGSTTSAPVASTLR